MTRGVLVRRLVVAGLLALLTSMSTGSASAQKVQSSKGDRAVLVWLKELDRGNEVFYSIMQGREWGRPLRLSEGARTNLLPTLAMAEDGLSMVVWAVQEGEGSSLRFAVVRNDQLLQEPRRIETGLRSNMAPFLAADPAGVFWLVWSGNSGGTSDIYFSRWENGVWLPPQRVHPENEVPDILPELQFMANGSLIARWRTHGAEGLTFVVRKLENRGIKAETTSPPVQWLEGNTPLECIAPLPGEVAPERAALLAKCADGEPHQLRVSHEVLQQVGTSR